MRAQPATPAVAWTAIIGLVLVSALIVIVRDPLRINHDCAMYLQAGSLLLDGRLPYADVVDLNPPLIMYLSTVPALIARGLEAPPIVTFLVCVWLLTLVSTFATRRVLAKTCAPHESIQVELVALAIAGSSLIALRDNVFGQREHLFVLGLFPYLAFRFRHWEGMDSSKLPALAAGVLAGLTACLKPHFVVIALVPELYWLATRRRARPLLRPELAALTGVGLVYAAHFLVLPDSVRTAFFGRWLPLVAGAYHVYDKPWREVFRSSPQVWLPAVASLFVLLRSPRPRDVAWRLTAPLVAIIVTATAMFFVQQKGWPYQGLPVAASSLVLLALCAGQLVTGRSSVPAQAGLDRAAAAGSSALQVAALAIATCLAFAGVTLALRKPIDATSDRLSRDPVARAIGDASREGEPVLVISSSVPHSYPLLLQLNRRPGSRFLFFFPIPLLYSGVVGSPGHPFPYRGADGADSPTEEETAFLADLAADIETISPKAIFIDSRTCQACPRGFDIHEYLERTSFIARALPRYRRAGLVKELVLYLPVGESTP